MKLYIVSDTHMGMRSGSQEWLKMTNDWFNDDFIPEIKKTFEPGDQLVHVGDVFDNRQSISLPVQHSTIDIFEKLSKIFFEGSGQNSIHILLGNHDVWKTTTNEITSVDCLKYIPGVKIYKEPEIVQFSDIKFLIMPWRASIDEERQCIEQFKKEKPSYIFCHADVKNMLTDKSNRMIGGLEKSDLQSFKKVYCGHIHYRQESDNIVMVGNPYQMTRSDIDNQKGWYILDLKTETQNFVPNQTSPKFIRLNLIEYLEKPVSSLIDDCKGNWVDLSIPSSFVSNGYQLNDLIDRVTKSAKRVEIMVYDEEVSIENIESKPIINLMEISEQYVSKINGLDPTVRTRLIDKLNEYYDKLTNENT